MEIRGQEPKRHHFVPVTYLKAFCNSNQKLWIYDKEKIKKEPLEKAPKNEAFIKDYNSIQKPDGTWDHGSLEKTFSKFENAWPSTRKIMVEAQNSKKLEMPDCFLDFMALQCARAPFWRSICSEAIDNGHIPRPMSTQSSKITIMKSLVKIIEPIIKSMDFQLLTNKTETPFITSDNPVIWFRPKERIRDLKPYGFNYNATPIILLFPLTSKHLMYGSTNLKQFDNCEWYKSRLRKSEETLFKELNKYICLFAQQKIYASENKFTCLISKYGDKSPIIESFREDGTVNLAFGKARNE